MLSINVIDRHFRHQRFDRLLESVTANGLTLPLPLKMRLAEHPAGAVALTLRRVVDLTYGPTSLSRGMVQFLAEAQGADGSFDGDPLATAAVAAALGHLLDGHLGATDETAGMVRERALAALVGMQDEQGLFARREDRTLQDRALGSAFILYLLAGDEEFRQTVRFADLVSWLEQQEDLDGATQRLWRLAQFDAPAAASEVTRISIAA